MAQIQVQHQGHVNGAVAAAAAAAAANAAGGNQFVSTSLYVGDLDFSVTDSQLYDLFNQVGQVVSVRVCRDLSTRRSLGYGYVNYNTPQDAARAMEVLNFTPLNGKCVRIMYSHRDPSLRKSGTANIFIKNLDKAIDNKALHDTFSSFGNILSCKIATDPSGQSKGYGFVQFDNGESAQNAIDKLNGMLMNDKQVYVGHFLRKQERETVMSKTKFNNVYVKNLAESTTEEDLKKIFGEYGTITSAVVMRDGDGKSKCFGFVNFENADDAAKAVDALNGKKIDGKEWYVGKAQKKSERELELKSRFEQSAKEAVDKFQGLNLYVKNLDDSIDDEKLKEMFSEFGTITSCKVMRDPSGISRGSGFVAFSTPEEATRALGEMNGKMISGKPLYVALAQRKEERRARLQAQFSQMRPVAMPPSIAPRMPMYPPGPPAIGQQLFYGQAPPTIIPPQAGFGYQQQLVPGMRPGGGPMPNFFVPMVQQGQQGQRPGGRRGAGPVQQAQQPVPLMPQQMLPRGRVYPRYPPGRNVPDVGGVPGVGGMLSVPYDMAGMLPRDAAIGQSMPIPALASALANAPPEQQRTMLGESLYPQVDQLEHEHAAKVTGMLLEMDQTEVLHLLESPDALKAKVAEAMEVLDFNIYNKQVLKVFPYPVTVSLVQFAVGTVLVILMWTSNLYKRPKISGAQLAAILPLAVVHTLGNLFTNMSLGKVAVSFTHTIKAMEPFFSVVLSAMFLGEMPTFWVVGSLLPIVGGVALASMTEASFNWAGFWSAMASNLTNQSRNVLSKKFMVKKEDSLDNITLFSIITIMSFFLVAPVTLFMEGIKFTPSYLQSIELNVRQVYIRTLIAALCFHAYQQVSYMILQRVSPVTHSVGNCVKRVVVIVSSVLFFRSPVSPVNSLGTGVALAGVFLYSRVKRIKPKTA